MNDPPYRCNQTLVGTETWWAIENRAFSDRFDTNAPWYEVRRRVDDSGTLYHPTNPPVPFIGNARYEMGRSVEELNEKNAGRFIYRLVKLTVKTTVEEYREPVE